MNQENRHPARVNITLNIANKEAQEKKELPMRLLVLADFTKSAMKQSLAKQERLAVTLANYQQVLSYLNPTLTLTFLNNIQQRTETLSLDLSFYSLQDFHPKAIVRQVPILQRLAAMQNLLKELRSNLIDNTIFRQKLQELLCDKQQVEDFYKELTEMQS